MDNTEDFFKNYRGKYSQYWIERWGLIPELPTSFDNANSMYELVAWLQRAFKNLLDDFQQLEAEFEDFRNALIDLLEYLIPELIRRYSNSAEFRTLFIGLLEDILAGEERNWVKDLLKELLENDMREWIEVYLKDLYGLELNKTNAQLAQIASNVKNFGALGDGVSDDTLAIQNTLDSLVDGGTLYFPDGVYIKSDVLTIKHSNVKVVFSQNAKVIEKTRGVTGFTVSENLTNVSFENLKLFGLSDNREPANAGISLRTGVTDVHLSHCLFDGYSIGFIAQRLNERITIDKCRFYNATYIPSLISGGYGIVLQASKDTQITNNYFDESVQRHQIYVSRNQQYPNDVGYNHVIANNIFKGENKEEYATGFEYRIKIMGNQNATVTTNVFDGGVGHVMVVSNGAVDPHCKNIVVTNNTFMNLYRGSSNNSGAFISNAGSIIENLIVANNVIRDCDAHFGIRLDMTVNSKIDNNLIVGTPKMFGIMVERYITNTYITNNQLDGDFDRGINIGTNTSIPSKNIRITGNTLKGIYPCFLNYVESATISDNEFISSRFQCIYFGNSVKFTGTITGNTLIGGNTGIRLNIETTDPIFIHSNVFKGQSVYRIDNAMKAFLLEPIKNASGDSRMEFNVQTVLTKPPTSGTWTNGDIVWNKEPGVGRYMGWVCTLSGTPGTWKGFSLIEE